MVLLQRGLEFVEKTGFPADHLLADPDNITYDALQFKKGVMLTFFSAEVRRAGRSPVGFCCLCTAEPARPFMGPVDLPCWIQ